MATVWDVFMQKTEELHEEISHGIAAKAQELGEDIEDWKKPFLEKIKILQESYEKNHPSKNDKDVAKENDINSNNQSDTIQIKHEKISLGQTVFVKTKNELMPPPVTGAVKKARKKASSTRSTRSSARTNIKVEPQTESDDVIIEEVNVPKISLSDSDEEPDISTIVTRVTRSKAKPQKKSKKTSLEVDESITQTKKKMKVAESRKDENNIDATVAVEIDKQVNTFVNKQDEENNEDLQTNDALDYVSAETEIMEKTVQQIDKTYVSKKNSNKTKQPKVNNTVTVEKPAAFINETFVKTTDFNKEQAEDIMPNMNDLLTDDESIEDSLSPVQTKSSKVKKPLFNTYTASPVKQKIEAFEKLEASSKKELTPRQTRTKTRANAKKVTQEEPTPIPKQSKLPTPMSSNKFLSTQTSSLFRTKEKTSEALRKKEALLHAQSEERKRKREEKQLKAQQLREMKEKEKQHYLEMTGKQKEQRARMVNKEKQDYLQKQKEEMDLKRLLVVKRAAEERKKLEEEKRRQLMEKKKPIYMTTAMPLLPTADCYDSDSEADSKEISPPAWEKSSSFLETLACLENSSSTILQTLFCLKAQTPDLSSIFQNISERKLRRNSSAIWEREPKYSILPPTSMCEEFLSFTDDDVEDDD